MYKIGSLPDTVHTVHTVTAWHDKHLDRAAKSIER